MGYRNALPFEVLSGPQDLWLAPVGTAFPKVDVDPPSPWALLGLAGADNYAEDGINVANPQSTNVWRSLKSTGPKKVFRGSEDFTIKLMVADLSLETWSVLIEGNTVTPTSPSSGVPGVKTIGLSRGTSVRQVAVLLRGASPYGDDMAMQYEIPVASLLGSPDVGFKKDTPGLLAVEITCIEDPDAANDAERFGRLVAQTDQAGT